MNLNAVIFGSAIVVATVIFCRWQMGGGKP